MPKTYNNLWGQMVSFESLFKAYKAAVSNKRYRSSSLAYRERLEENLLNTLALLEQRKWQPAPYREFCVFEPKKRIINAPAFKDRVIHHALVRIIEPLFERKFIFDSYACRKGKGTHAAKERVEKFAMAAGAASGSYYVLKGDIKAYFYSIDREVLVRLIERTVADKSILWLIRQIIAADGESRGIPIGALTSQLFANVYLDALDHFVKDELGIRMYVRYMDDFVVIHHDKDHLKSLLAGITAFVERELHLELNPKTTIFKSGRGECHPIDFCGYRIWPDCTKPRKRTVKVARRRFKKLAVLHSQGSLSFTKLRSSIMSFIGYMKHCSGRKSLESILAGIKVKSVSA